MSDVVGDPIVERAAQAIWRADENAHEAGWWEVTERWRDHYHRLARAAIEAMELRQEYEIHTDGSYHLHTRTLSYSEALNELRKAQSVEAATPNPTEWDRNPQIHTRLVGPWRVGGDT